MLGTRSEKVNEQEKSNVASAAFDDNHCLQHDEKQLNELFMRSRSGLWALFVYLSVSVFAYYFREQSLASVLPAYLMQKLGAVPPIFMANWLLWVSTFSALIVIAGRLYDSSKPSSTMSHLLFRLAFYLLYFVVGGTDQHINELFISGLVVLALQHHNVYSYYAKEIEVNFEVFRLSVADKG